MEDIMEELEKFDLDKREIKQTEIEQIQVLSIDFINAYKNGDDSRRDRLFQVFLTLSKTKENIKTLQEYFGGKKIGIVQDTILAPMALEYVMQVWDSVRALTDWHVKPEPWT